MDFAINLGFDGIETCDTKIMIKNGLDAKVWRRETVLIAVNRNKTKPNTASKA